MHSCICRLSLTYKLALQVAVRFSACAARMNYSATSGRSDALKNPAFGPGLLEMLSPSSAADKVGETRRQKGTAGMAGKTAGTAKAGAAPLFDAVLGGIV